MLLSDSNAFMDNLIPAELKEEDYKKFYREFLYPMSE